MRSVVLVVTCLLVATACDRTPARQAQPPPPPVWEQTLAEVDDDGAVSLATALKAYSIAVRPLPGVTVPPRAHAAPIPSGTVAVRWLLQHWDALSPAQQQAVAGSAGPPRKLRDHRAAPPSADPNALCASADAGAAQTYRAWGDGILAEIAKRLGRATGAGFRITYASNTREAEGAVMYAVPCRGGRDVATAKTGPIDGCTVHVNPSARQLPSVDQRTLLIHELMHCVLYDEFDYDYNLMPNWYAEGAPTWVQAVLGDIPVPAPIWRLYMDMPNQPLYRMHYQGVGFFIHLAETGTDPWTRLVPIGAALKGGRGAAANRAGWDAAGVTPAFLDTWGPSFAAGRYPGRPWTTTGPNVPSYLGTLPKQPVRSGATVAVTSRPAGATLVELQPAGDVVLVAPGPTARGRFAIGVGVDMGLPEAAGTVFCAKTGGCTCPEGSPGAGTPFKPLAGGPNYLGVTGGPEAATVEVAAMTLDEFCGRKRDTCLVGSWTSTGVDMTVAGTRTAGGAGVRLVIDRAGKTTVSFDGMAPVQIASSETGLAGSFVYHGGVAGTLKLPPPGATSGTWEYADTGSGSISATMTLTSPVAITIGPISLTDLARQAGGGGVAGASPVSPGRWTCSGDALATLSTIPEASGGWNWRRTG